MGGGGWARVRKGASKNSSGDGVLKDAGCSLSASISQNNPTPSHSPTHPPSPFPLDSRDRHSAGGPFIYLYRPSRPHLSLPPCAADLPLPHCPASALPCPALPCPASAASLPPTSHDFQPVGNWSGAIPCSADRSRDRAGALDRRTPAAASYHRRDGGPGSSGRAEA